MNVGKNSSPVHMQSRVRIKIVCQYCQSWEFLQVKPQIMYNNSQKITCHSQVFQPISPLNIHLILLTCGTPLSRMGESRAGDAGVSSLIINSESTYGSRQQPASTASVTAQNRSSSRQCTHQDHQAVIEEGQARCRPYRTKARWAAGGTRSS